MGSSDKKVEITDKESRVLALAWSCFKTHPDLDIEKLAKLAGYTNPKSVSNIISAVKKKAALMESEGNSGGEGPSTPVKRTPKGKAKVTRTPASHKRKTKGDDEDDSSDPATPTSKRARGKKTALSKAFVERDEGSEGGKKVVKMDSQDDEPGVPEDVVE
ncbi:uncharacterized protein GGS22DRAFT_160820 [Annulohypoxylon maeteangense]|uniref:uncharacterized protein n=1 Tax=Annulohypoxylon maeteangense TaxID=1927788 RepID=UPI00200836BB|nr:uncharacterized protein GGS22DRAFT_160820 [Annulohypoxylon maeteangense]KAI0886440.1 hypothetical protein GGS22DRAFT_160820 [Annulohypoxylon maeteangense]